MTQDSISKADEIDETAHSMASLFRECPAYAEYCGFIARNYDRMGDDDGSTPCTLTEDEIAEWRRICTALTDPVNERRLADAIGRQEPGLSSLLEPNGGQEDAPCTP